MPSREAYFRNALQAVIAKTANQAERQLIGDAFQSGHLNLAEGERAVAGDSPGATIVTGDNSVVLHIHAAKLPELRALFAEFLTNSTPVPLQALHTASRNQLHQDFESRVKDHRYFPDCFLPRKVFDTDFYDFLSSRRNILVLLATAGIGKTAMLGHWADLCMTDSIIVFFDEADKTTYFHFEQDFRKHLELGLALGDRTTKQLLDSIDRVLLDDKKYLVWFIDALDKMPDGAGFIRELSKALQSCHPTRLKLVLSCRTGVWPYMNYSDVDAQPYLSNDVASEVHLTVLTFTEVEQLYSLYQRRYHCLKDTTDVDKSVLDVCRIPLVLSLLVKTYASERGRPLPDEQVNALEEYFK